jgi:hypothetical protein
MIEKQQVTAKSILEKLTKERSDKKLRKEEKEKANTFFDRVFNSLTKTRTRKLSDPNTSKFIGMRFKYMEDSYGKSIYDYVCYNNDPFEQKLLEKIEVKFDDNDPKDGSWVDKPIQIVWLDVHY